MELAIHLNVSDWYTPSQHNNFSHWGLDYPPLSGYQSWVCGKVIALFEPAAMELTSSQGYESTVLKVLMRWSVVVFDLLVFFPAALYSCRSLQPSQRVYTLAALLLQPVAVLTDHGHFQYNNISLGLSAAAATAISAGHHLLASCLFSLALNHKQMTLFFAPAFFAHLLGCCLHRPGLMNKVYGVGRLGVVVVLTFAVCWSPYLTSVESVLQVLRRIFPLQRGLYEDYVANWWCATSSFIKWKQLFAGQEDSLVRLCAGLVILVSSPAMCQQLARPSSQGLLLCMANTAWAFFMFSFQVHEKSVLLPLLPLTMLAAQFPGTALWLPLLGAFSMYPLLIRDGVGVAYAAACTLYLVLMWPVCRELQGGGATPRSRRLWWWARWLEWGVLAAMLLLHAAREVVKPPANLPWLHDRLFITLAFIFFAVTAVLLQWCQWHQPPAIQATSIKKKKA